jgi:uncharacterized protein YndB with AHSA1/START domain
MTPGDAATVSVFVAVPPDSAFQVFTEEIDQWWRTGPRFRIGGKRAGRIYFEPGPSGRLFETFEAASGTRTFEVGKVTVWEPPGRLALEWRGVNFKPEDDPGKSPEGEKTFVEVTFEPMRDGTTVTVRHSGWSALGPKHPARHGLEGSAFTRTIGLFWGDLMTSLREHVMK